MYSLSCWKRPLRIRTKVHADANGCCAIQLTQYIRRTGCLSLTGPYHSMPGTRSDEVSHPVAWAHAVKQCHIFAPGSKTRLMRR